MAATAVRLVLALGRGEAVEGRSIELATSLVTRETTASYPWHMCRNAAPVRV